MSTTYHGEFQNSPSFRIREILKQRYIRADLVVLPGTVRNENLYYGDFVMVK